MCTLVIASFSSVHGLTKIMPWPWQECSVGDPASGWHGGGTARTGHTLSKGTDLPGRCHPVWTPPPRLRALDQDRPPLNNLQTPASLSGSKLLLSATKEHVAVS